MSDFIQDNKTYYLGKDLHGINHTMRELHEILLSIILELDRICRLHDIPYALAFGSTIGAINYGGFIPWDDDADIAIMYHDVARLIEALKNDLSNEYSFECFETNPKYLPIIPTIKIRKKGTYIKETNSMNLPNRCGCDGFFIDIVAFMGVPSEPKEHKKLIKKSKRQMPLYVLFESYFHINMLKMKKNLKQFEKEVANKYKDSPYLGQTVIIPFQDWKIAHEVNKLSFPRDVILPFKEIQFEGHNLFSFAKPEEFIKLYYGDKALKVFKDGKYFDLCPFKYRKVKHFKKYLFQID